MQQGSGFMDVPMSCPRGRGVVLLRSRIRRGMLVVLKLFTTTW